MARVRIHDGEEPAWHIIRTWTSEKIKAQISDLELDSTIRELEQGSENTLQLFEIKFLPNTLVDVHAHDEEEIMYIVDGMMIIGERILGPGSSIYIAGSTLYSFRAGAKGLRVLNFRPRQDATYHSRAAFLKARSERIPA